MKDSLSAVFSLLAKPVVAIGGAVVIGVALVGYTYLSTMVSPSGATAMVTRGTLTQEVDVSGSVKAAHETDLSFQIPGRVAAILVSVGDHVNAGQPLLALDSSSQVAAYKEAKAALEVQQAKLAILESGTRPEQLAIDEANFAQAQSALLDALQNAYVAADDAVHAKADQVFTNPNTPSVTFAFQVADANLADTVTKERIGLETMFAAWQSMNAASSSDPVRVAGSVTGYLGQVNAFLGDLAALLAETPAGGSLTATNLSSYRTAVNAARTEITGAVTGVLPGVTNALTGYKSAQGALTLAQAGATPDELAAQQAAVDAAQAAVESAQVAMNETGLVAPVSGTVTAQNANPGETVAPGTPLVSMVADGKYQATARVSDTDIAKVAVGQTVAVTFPSYPGVSFSAKVTTVDPAASVVNGVSSYGVTVTFDENDPRLSSGMSTNLRIVTRAEQDVLTVPSSAVISDGTNTFVYVRKNGAWVKTSVATGIESASGSTEIMSGLAEGETVLTYGGSAGQ